MTEREAIKVFDGLRKACRSLNVQDQVQAQNLLSQAHVIPSALMYEIPKALGALRAVFDAIEKWEALHPN
ncbi:MAG TPA: hypothetical protein VEC38_09405 [Candidatus Binataceae bacterium]|nr:hypothetical protein [Candidatus Binataceae bacterium]